ncbi:MAG: tetratricopeptide repeat protein, partial [Gammaproteobacteria bacterium]
AGIQALKALFAGGVPVDPGDVLPVLFDLQTIGRNKDAIPFFEALLQDNLTAEQQRQLLFWIADSYKGLGDYAQAAELYLRSATLGNPYAMDQWAQSARYQAAQMLAKAGYIDDARNLYQGLLNATRDPGQQAMLRHDLQQLMLLPRSKPAGKP